MRFTTRKIANCKRCGKLFIKQCGEVCPDCLRQDLNTINNVCNLLDATSKPVKVEEVASLTNTSAKAIERLQQRGRFWAYKNLEVSCRFCGESVNTSKGRDICDDCYAKLCGQIQPILARRSSKTILKGIQMHSRKNADTSYTRNNTDQSTGFLSLKEAI
ncbi:MAG: hypothetical protein AB1782_06415 [Cyanobacteriota bacterium]